MELLLVEARRPFQPFRREYADLLDLMTPDSAASSAPYPNRNSTMRARIVRPRIIHELASSNRTADFSRAVVAGGRFHERVLARLALPDLFVLDLVLGD